jgi:NAD(P)-dependent dehydrogenase (short-subunit alcohol dehydrogenase family)
MTNIDGAVVLVTGANGGLGIEFVKQALERGASKVYASARTPREWNDPRIVPLALDVTSPESIEAAVKAAPDVSILVNNAGISSASSSITAGTMDDLRSTFETNFFGAVAVGRAFAPVVGANGGGAFIDVHSALSWVGWAGAYSASKAAFWSATNSFRLELFGQGTHVLGLHLGYTDTPMTKDVTDPKGDPADVVRAAFDGLEAGEFEVLADETSVNVKSALSAPLVALYPSLA